MGTLYIDRKDIELRPDGNCLAIYERGERQRSVPAGLLERVVVHGSARFTSGLLGWLSNHGVGLVVLSGWDSRQVAALAGTPHADARRRIAQCRMYLDEGWRRRWSRALVKAKLKGQRRLLLKARLSRPDASKELRDAAATLEDLLGKLAAEPGAALPTLTGWEGAGAAAYFEGYCRLFAPALQFRGRNRRPPRDPVNACLSLAYTLAHFEAVRAAQTVGLDPYLGFYHEIAYGRESLGSDLIEPLRPRVDEWVWGLFRERELRVEHFRQDGAACLLMKAGRRHFYEAWEGFVRPVRGALRRTCRLLLRALDRAERVEGAQDEGSVS